MSFQNAEFVKSAASRDGFIRDGRPGIVFAGRSNVGKSSAINRLLGRKSLARTGGQPGKTAQVNYFLVDGRLWFVDLPGYGYAKVPKSERERWGRLMEAFFAEEENISAGVLIVDARHAPTADDATMARWFLETERPLIVCANKCDKLNASEAAKAPGLIRQTLALPEAAPIVLFSAERGDGKAELIGKITEHL